MTETAHVKSSLHATNVGHYAHVIAALQAVSDQVVLIRRPQPRFALKDQRTAVSRVLSRRQILLPDEVNVQSLPTSQFLYPLAARLGVPIPSRLDYLLVSSHAKRVEKTAVHAQLLHVIEGLALPSALSRRVHAKLVLEARSLHHGFLARPLHALGEFPYRAPRSAWGKAYDAEHRRADRVIVYSQKARQSYIEAGVAEEKIRIVPLPLWSEQPERHGSALGGSRRPESFLYVGRGDAARGLDVAVLATAGHRRQLKLRIAGPMSRPVLRWLANFDHVQYLGILTAPELKKEYESCCALVAPSIESFGLAVAEAVLHGAPVLCRETTGIAEYFDRQVQVIPGRDLDAWRDAVKRVADAPPNRPLSEVPDQLKPTSVVSALIQIYSEL